MKPTVHSKKTYIAYALLVLTALFWASNIVLGKSINREITPLSLAFLRWATASCIVLPFAINTLRRDWRAIIHGWRMLVLLSLLGVSVFNTILYAATHTTDATNIALIQTSMPLFVVLLSYVLFAQVITRGMLLGVVLGISGAVFVILKGQLLSIQTLHLARGDLSMVFAAFTYALYSVLLPKSPRLHPLSFLAVTFLLGSLLLLPFFIWERLALPPIVFTTHLSLTIVYVAIFPSILAYLFWNHGVTVVGSNTTGLFACFIPVFTPLIATVFLSETLHIYHAIGLVLIIVGVLTLHSAKSPHWNESSHT